MLNDEACAYSYV